MPPVNLYAAENLPGAAPAAAPSSNPYAQENLPSPSHPAVQATIASSNVPPTAAASAFNTQQTTGIPAVIGMHNPAQGIGMAGSINETAVLNSSPHLQRWIGDDPVRAAAARDDLPVLARLGSYFGSGASFNVTPGQNAMLDAFMEPFYGSLGLTQRSVARTQALQRFDFSHFDIRDMPLMQGGPSANEAFGLFGIATSGLTGGINAGIVRPLGIAARNLPIYGIPGHPYQTVLSPIATIDPRYGRLSPDDAQRQVESSINLALMLVGRAHTPEGFTVPETTPQTPLRIGPGGSMLEGPRPGEANGPIDTSPANVAEGDRLARQMQADALAANENEGTLAQGEAIVRESELAGASPQLAAEYIDSAREPYGPPAPTVTVPASLLTEMANEAGQLPQALQHIDGLEEGIARALPIGGHVEMSLGQFTVALAALDNTQAQRLREGARVGDAPSVADTQESQTSAQSSEGQTAVNGEFRGTLNLLHGSQNENLTAFNSPKSIPLDQRYDAGGSTFGTNGIYLDNHGQFVTPGGMSGFVAPHVYQVQANFERAFVLSPETVEKFHTLIPNADQLSGEQVTERLRAAGYDGLIVQGFDEQLNAAFDQHWEGRPRDENGIIAPKTLEDEAAFEAGHAARDALLAQWKIPSEFTQSQVVAFNHENVAVRNKIETPTAFDLAGTRALLPPMLRIIQDAELTPDETQRATIVAQNISAEVSQAAQTLSLNRLFIAPKDAQMTKLEFRTYSQRIDTALADAETKLIKRAIAQIKRERAPDWREHQEQNIDAIQRQLFERRDLIAYFWLRYGETPAGAPIDPLKLDKEASQLSIGDSIDRLPKTMFAKARTRTGKIEEWNVSQGLLPDDLATLVDPTYTGVEMLRDIVAIEDAIKASGITSGREYLKKITKALASNLTGEELGFDLTPENIRAEAIAAVNGKVVEDLLISELKGLGLPFDKAALRLQTQLLFEDYPVKEAQNLRYFERSFADAAIRAQRALQKGDTLKAFKAKQEQLITHWLLIESHNFNRRVARDMTRIGRWARRATLTGMDQETLNYIQTIIRGMDISIGGRDDSTLLRDLQGKSLSQFMSELSRRYTPLAQALYDADGVMIMPSTGPWKDMTMNEYVRTTDLLYALAKAGRNLETVTIANRKVAMDQLRRQALATASQLKTYEPNLQMGGRKDMGEAWRSTWGLKDAGLRTAENQFNYLDALNPRGTWNVLMMDGAVEAANEKASLMRDYLTPITEAYNLLPKEITDTYHNQIPSSDHPFLFPRPTESAPPEEGEFLLANEKKVKLLRQDLIPIMLNMGNEENFQKLAKGYRTTTTEVENFVDRYAKKEEWDFVQKIWNILEGLFPVLEAHERRMRGYGIKKVPPREVMTVFGKYPGGYYPIVYDPRWDRSRRDKASRLANDPISARFANAGLPESMVSQRMNYIGPIFVSLEGTLIRHLDDMFTRIAYEEWYDSASRWIKDPVIREIVDTRMGPEYTTSIEDWIRDQIVDPMMMSPQDHAEFQGFLRQLRLNMQLAIMGFSSTTGLSQVAGNLATLTKLGFKNRKWLRVGWTKMFELMTKEKGELEDFIFSRSEEMKHRADEIDRELRDILRTQFPFDPGMNAAAREFRNSQRASMHFIGLADRYLVSFPAWLGEYLRAKEEGHLELDACRLADKMVRESQGSGRVVTLSRFQRTSDEFKKMFTFAYNWGNTYYNLLHSAAQEYALSGGGTPPPPEGPDFQVSGEGEAGRPVVPRPPSRGEALWKWFMLLAAMPIGSALVSLDWPDDWSDPESVARWFAERILLGPFSSVPFFRDAAHGTITFIESPRHDLTEVAEATGSSIPLVRVGVGVTHMLSSDYAALGNATGQDLPLQSHAANLRLIQNNAEGAALMFGIGGGYQIGRTGEYLFELHSGDQAPTHPVQLIEGVVRGPQRNQQQ